ncbi:MAG: FadR/GntR family transcriptional regulator [Clostridiaceae bacterium]
MIESSRTKKIQQELRSMILIDEDFKPGDKLPNENELAQKFDVSRPVIREAIKALEAQGVLIAKHGSGTYVSEYPGFSNDPLGFSDIQDKTKLLENWYEARKALESEVVRMVVKNATDEDLDVIKYWVEKIELSIQYGDKEFLKTDRKFHIALANATHNPIMERLMIVLMQSFYYSVADSLEVKWYYSAMENALKHHRRILQSLMERDEVGAILAMRSHMVQATTDLLSTK